MLFLHIPEVLTEFNEKLQELRRQKGLTQEELANQLFVTRAAVPKWESGRGYPSIDSLKAISKFFSISQDDLLFADRSNELIRGVPLFSMTAAPYIKIICTSNEHPVCADPFRKEPSHEILLPELPA